MAKYRFQIVVDIELEATSEWAAGERLREYPAWLLLVANQDAHEKAVRRTVQPLMLVSVNDILTTGNPVMPPS